VRDGVPIKEEAVHVEEVGDMYAITVVLFSIPMWISIVAWRHEHGLAYEPAQRRWRSYCLRLALFLGLIATLTGMGFWLVEVRAIHFQGTFHTRVPAVMALYVPLQEVAKWTVLATLGVGILAKGKGRLLVLGAALSIFLVNILLGCWKS
jgi:hypothetical protein